MEAGADTIREYGEGSATVKMNMFFEPCVQNKMSVHGAFCLLYISPFLEYLSGHGHILLIELKIWKGEDEK